MHDLAFKKISKRGQPDVWVLAYVHITSGLDGSGAHVVYEDKWTDHPLLTERKKPADKKVPNVSGSFFNDEISI
tara:strand:- start:818 stop:1039 length:222 start_codon:yes stop_codon:yes gene_type:complete